MPKEFDETKKLAEISQQIKSKAISTASLHLQPLPKEGGVSRSMADLIADEDKKLNGQRSSSLGAPCLIPIDLIDESPYQTTRLSEEKVAELSSNLATNPLSSPIVVRQKPSLRFELIAGRHRLAAYKRLQRKEIEGTIKELDDEQAEKLVFYDNLFGPNLSDYEKYLGFAQRQKNKKLTQQELAREAGVSQGLISKLMSFDGLPSDVSQVMEEYPKAIGVLHASEFVRLSNEKPSLAIQAIQKIATGELTQKAALAWIKNGGTEPPKKVRREDDLEQAIKMGTKPYAKMLLRENRLLVTFSDTDEGLELWSEVEKLLKNRATTLKSKSS